MYSNNFISNFGTKSALIFTYTSDLFIILSYFTSVLLLSLLVLLF